MSKMQKCLITNDLEKLKIWINPELIPNIDNENFSLGWKKELENKIFIIKPNNGCSVMDSLDIISECDSDPNTITRLREFYVNEQSQANSLMNSTGNSTYQLLLANLKNSQFAGIIFCNLGINIKKNNQLGPSKLTTPLTYQVPLFIVDNVGFTGEKIDLTNSDTKGWVTTPLNSNEYTDKERTFSLTVSRVFSFFEDNNFLNPSLILTLSLYTLFGIETSSSECLSFYGVYTYTKSGSGSLNTYHFIMISGSAIQFKQSSLSEIFIEHAIVGFHEESEGSVLDLSCSGAFRFQSVTPDFDPFSYGYYIDTNNNTMKDSFLRFEHYHIEITFGLKAGKTERYRNIRLFEPSNLVRPGGLLEQLPHKNIFLISYQDGDSPETLGFKQIQIPLSQQKWSEKTPVIWFGIVVSVEYFHGLNLELLFTFSNNEPFYAGSRIRLGMGQTGLQTQLEISSLISLSISNVLLAKGTDGATHLMLQGVKASLLGIQIPEGSLNITLLEDKDKKTAWYCVYDK